MAFEDPAPRHNPASAAGHHFAVEERKLPSATKLLEESFRDLQDNFGGYFAVGLPMVLVSFALAIVLAIGLFVVMAPLLMLSGSSDEDFSFIMALMAVAGTSTAVVTLLILPFQASLGRAVWDHIVNQTPLTFSSAVKDLRKDVVSVVGVQVIIIGLTFVGMLFFFLPMIFVSIACSFALPAIIAHRLGAFEAIALSFSHTKSNFWWHTKVWILGTLVVVAASQVPILGTVMAGPWMFAYLMRAYRASFGDAETLPLH